MLRPGGVLTDYSREVPTCHLAGQRVNALRLEVPGEVPVAYSGREHAPESAQQGDIRLPYPTYRA
jgi:hypothetical protein